MNTKDTEVRPVILKVTGASGDVEDEGVTPDNILTFSGMAGAGVRLEVFDNAYPVEEIDAESDGSWRLTLSGLTEREHFITVGNVGGQWVSDAWSFTVMSSTTGFEGFEAERPRPVSYVPVDMLLPSGLKISSYKLNDHMPPVLIVRSSSPQGEHGFQYLNLRSTPAEGYSALWGVLPSENVTRLSFALWGPAFTAAQSAVVHIYDSDSKVIGSLDVEIPMSNEILVDIIAPSGLYIASFRLNPGYAPSSTFDIACDSIRWSS